MLTRIPAPTYPVDGELAYLVRPREKRFFHTILDANTLLSPGSASTVRYESSGSELVLSLEQRVARGTVREELRCAIDGKALIARDLSRRVDDRDGRRVRLEEVVFGASTLRLPDTVYPEVALPFLLGWLPHDGQTRSLHAWINDRFVARVYVETRKPSTLSLPAGRRQAMEAIMYPDLNDWVRLPKIITKLSKPFVPKYHMWHSVEPPHRLLRFEGPYGPPGAPEVVLELSRG